MPWGSFPVAAAALKTPTRNGYNAQGGNLTICGIDYSQHFYRRTRLAAVTRAEAAVTGLGLGLTRLCGLTV